MLGLSPGDEFPFFLLGNKCDLPGKVVEASEGREWAGTNGNMLFYEMSAKDTDTVRIAFEDIARKSLARHRRKESMQIASFDVPIPKTFFSFFSTQPDYRSVRLTQTDVNHDDTHHLWLTAAEFLGTLSE
jgi:GTPase SAR1 family protein